MPRSFPIKGPDLGFPGQGISCSPEGEEEEREAHGRSAFRAFLAAAASSCLGGRWGHWLGAALCGLVVWGVLWDIPVGVSFGFGVTGDHHLVLDPPTPVYCRKKKKS